MWHTVLLWLSIACALGVAVCVGVLIGRAQVSDPGVPLIGGDDPEVQPGSILDGGEVPYGALDHELTLAEQGASEDAGRLRFLPVTGWPDIAEDAIGRSLAEQLDSPVQSLMTREVSSALQVTHDPDRVWVKEESRATTREGPWSDPEIRQRITLGSYVDDPDEWGKPWQQNSGMWVRVRETTVTREAFDRWLVTDTAKRLQPRAS